jgi:hypothetical protein
MKKLVMMAVAAFMATVSANAQFEKGTWSLQPFVGGGVATVTNAGDLSLNGYKLEKKATMAYLTGVEAEYQFADKFSVAAGLNYTSQGCAWDDLKYPDGTKINEIEAELGYIKIPMVANFYIFKGFAVKAGVQFGFLVNSKLNMHAEGKTDFGDGTNRDTDIYTSINVKDNFKKFDFSIPVGVSYQFKVPIVIDARYQIGLTKLNKGTADKNLKNSVFTLTVGYKFAL